MIRRGLVAAAALAALGALSAPAQAAFDITAFDGEVSSGPGGQAYTQAGGHPYEAKTTVTFSTVPDPFVGGVPDGNLRNADVTLPAGFVGNPSAAPKCSAVEFATNDCPAETQVGFAVVEVGEGAKDDDPVYNLEPAPNTPASFGFVILGTNVTFDAIVDSGNDYRVGARFRNTSQGIPVVGSEVTLWGVPADRNGSGGPRVPFVTLPTQCTAPGEGLVTEISANSWQDPTLVHDSFESHLPPGYPLPRSEWGPPQGPTGCEKVPFEVATQVEPTATQADSPSGLEVSLSIPQDGLVNVNGVATAHLKKAEVSLPQGMSVNPASVDGLGTCSEAQIGLGSDSPVSCPDSSKLGSVEVETPLLERTMEGSVYLAEQGTNPFGSLLALYLVAESKRDGITIKLPGKVSPDPVTGQLTATFDDNPQLPFSEMRLRFKGGARAPLITPETCGTYETVGKFTPWSAADPDNPTAAETVTTTSSFEITSGPNGQPCPNGRFAPELEAGTTNPVGGSYSPFLLRLSRPDGTQRLGALTATLPEGLTGKLAGIPYCPDAALAGVSGAEGSGISQIRTPSCPAASQVGTVTVGAGAGPSPFYVNTGKAYLAGPYKGAPLSMAFVTPAVAGPFDLGSVVVRAALQVNPSTAQVTAVSDQLPSILHGIPLDLRDVRVEMNRPGFMVNPTDCSEMATAGTATSTEGVSVPLSERFQAADCAALGFKPKLAMRFSGAPTRRGGYPKLTATLTMPPGGANIARAQVTMPKTQLLENAHIRTICTRVQWAAKTCPKAAIYGYAKAWSPLLDQPLQGPVYLRSSSNKLPDLVADLDGQIEIDLVGRIDTVRARIRNTFDLVPDAPVSKFQLTMQGGRKGLLVNNTNICKTKPIARARFGGQNGKVADSNFKVSVAGCGKAKRGGTKKK